jgi:chromosome segregation ATPase
MDFKQRSYNAVVAEGSDANMVRKALADIQDLQAKIDNRKRELSENPVITKYTEGLQNLIQISKGRLEAERAEREQEAKDAELAFAKEETGHKLSEAQKTQAERLKKQQHAINELRKQYAASLEKKSAESNESLKSLEGQMADLRSKLDERQRYLATEGSKKLTKEQEAARQAALSQKHAAVKAADEQARMSWELFYNAQTQLKVEEARRAEAEKLRPEFEDVEKQFRSEPAVRRTYVDRLDAKKEELKKLVTVVRPTGGDLARVVQEKDDSWLYVAGSWLGIVLVFGIAAVVVSASGGERRAGQYHPLDAEPIDREEEVPVG